MRPSPYTPGQVATVVPGREPQIEAIRERLSYVSQFQRFAGRIRVDVGPRGVGKTSLLRAMQAEANRIGFATVWVTAGDGPFLVALTEEFEKLAGDWKEKTKETLRQARRGSAGRALQDVIVAAGRGAVAGDQNGLALFVDEIQSADADGLRALGYAWQHMQSEAPDLPAVAFTAGLSHTQDVITDAVSFGERFQYNHVENLDEPAARFALTAPAGQSGVRWHETALAAVLGEVQGYPHFIQLLGDYVWQAAGYPDSGKALTARHFGVAMANFDSSRQDFFRARWTKASDRESELLVALARLGDGPQRRMDIAKALGVPTTAISMARRSLMDKGLIEASNHGYLRFTAPGFAQFVREQTDLGEDD